MERIYIHVVMPRVEASGYRLEVTPVAPPGETIVVERSLLADRARWLEEPRLATAWLGSEVAECWLAEEWGCTWHLRGRVEVEAVLPEVCFGRFAVRALVEEAPGIGAVVAEQVLWVSSEPPPVSGVRWLADDAQGRLRLAVR